MGESCRLLTGAGTPPSGGKTTTFHSWQNDTNHYVPLQLPFCIRGKSQISKTVNRISKYLDHESHHTHSNMTFVKDTGGWGRLGKGTGHTHADCPRRNTLTALLCSSVCCGHRWDLVGHKVALHIPEWRPPHSCITLPLLTWATEREVGRTLWTQSVTNQVEQQ